MNEINNQSLKQPKVFYLSCLTALFERFSYYILGFLMVLYVKSAFNFTDDVAFLLFAIFSAMTYFTPAIGGYLADNLIGIRRAMILGIIIEGLGLLVMSIPGLPPFYLGLVLIVLGVGLFKTGPTNLMARAYQDKDPRIDSGFTMYYMVMNVGSILSPIVGGYLQLYLGWNSMFIAAAISMLCCLGIYYLMRKTAINDDVKVGYEPVKLSVWLKLFIGLVVLGAVLGSLLVHLKLAEYFIFFASAIVLLYFLYEIVRSPVEEKKQIIVCLFLIGIGLVFFLLYFQMNTSMTMFIKRSVVHSFLGFKFPAPLLLSLNPFWVVVLSLVLAKLYVWLGRSGKDLAVTTKLPLGLIITSGCFFTLALSVSFANAAFQVSPLWVAAGMFFFCLGELMVSALGVAMVTHIAPPRMYGVMMGSWFLIAAALAAELSGHLASIASIPDSLTDAHAILLIYGHAFFKMGLIGLGVGVVVLLMSPFFKRLAKLD